MLYNKIYTILAETFIEILFEAFPSKMKPDYIHGKKELLSEIK